MKCTNGYDFGDDTDILKFMVFMVNLPVNDPALLKIGDKWAFEYAENKIILGVNQVMINSRSKAF